MLRAHDKQCRIRRNEFKNSNREIECSRISLFQRVQGQRAVLLWRLGFGPRAFTLIYEKPKKANSSRVMMSYIKYLSTAFLGLLIKIAGISSLVSLLGISYYLAYIITTACIIAFNYTIINKYIFHRNVDNKKRKILLFLVLSIFSIFLGWVIAAIFYQTTQNIPISTAGAGAITTSINYLFAKHKIWKRQ